MGVAAEQEEASSLKRSLSNEAASELGDLDRILDFVLCCLAHNLTNTSSSQRVPDLNMSFPLKYGYIEVQCHLSAQEGTVDGFETLHRDGRATTFRGEEGKLVLDATAGLHFLRLRYAQYTLRVGLFTLQGTLEAKLSPVALGARVALGAPPALDARLLGLRVAREGALVVDASGLGVWNPLLPLAQRWLNERMRHCLHRVAVRHLERLVQDTLQRLTSAVNALPPLPLFGNHMARQLPGINVAQSRECLQEKQDEQSNRERKLNLNKNNSLSRFMISPYFGKPLEHKSTVPFRCHC
ncbi:hypothetical protein R5R35_014410 [Gryllus longicercus]|uniref:Uncharacterized protein n=1 Tax=Gryllus longicercus TaxID=2509291 RepID=A0AAN9VY10_9ORTH